MANAEGYAARINGVTDFVLTKLDVLTGIEAVLDEQTTNICRYLHGKTFSMDGRRIFVGSFNFDQRSALLNTEMGLVIESPALAGRLADSFDNTIHAAAYEVRLKSDGNSMEWIERTAAGEVRHDADPGTGAFKRFGVEVLSVFPIDWML